MTNPILIKRSAVAAKVPATADLALGELAINTVDGKLYLKKNVSGTETVVEVGAADATAKVAAEAILRADGITAAISTAATDATTKANAAQAAAISTAASDATTKANAAQAAAISTAATDATTKANAAQAAAISTAASDATTKANAAQAAAIAAVTNGAGAAFDTLLEIQNAMATDAELSAAIAAISNVPSATKLQTARTIQGVSFDGTAPITVVTAGTGISVSGTAVSSTITQYTDAAARAAHSFVAGSGAYNSTTGVITIPTNTNQLTNGAGFITGYTETSTLAQVTARGATTATAVTLAGGVTTTALTTGATATAGTITGNWGLGAGSKLSATYADLAENYVADAEYAPGTVVEFGGDFEVTSSTEAGTTRVAGVVTTAPAYVMNSECAGEFIVTLALQGRVPVKVTGSVRKGDLLVSAGNGSAHVDNSARSGTIIGKSLENFTGETGVIEVAVGRF